LGLEEYPLPEFMSSKWLRSIRNPKSTIRNPPASPASLRENPHRELTRIIANFTGHWSPVTGHRFGLGLGGGGGLGLGLEEYPFPEFMSSKWLRSIRNPQFEIPRPSRRVGLRPDRHPCVHSIRNSPASPASLRENLHREFTRIIANSEGTFSRKDAKHAKMNSWRAPSRGGQACAPRNRRGDGPRNRRTTRKRISCGWCVSWLKLGKATESSGGAIG